MKDLTIYVVDKKPKATSNLLQTFLQSLDFEVHLKPSAYSVPGLLFNLQTFGDADIIFINDDIVAQFLPDHNIGEIKHKTHAPLIGLSLIKGKQDVLNNGYDAYLPQGFTFASLQAVMQQVLKPTPAPATSAPQAAVKKKKKKPQVVPPAETEKTAPSSPDTNNSTPVTTTPPPATPSAETATATKSPAANQEESPQKPEQAESPHSPTTADQSQDSDHSPDEDPAAPVVVAPQTHPTQPLVDNGSEPEAKPTQWQKKKKTIPILTEEDTEDLIGRNRDLYEEDDDERSNIRVDAQGQELSEHNRS